MVRSQRLSERALSQLPEILVTKQSLERMTNAEEALCAICHEDYAVGKRLLQLPCQHLFCVDCGQQWLRRSSSCPVCRTEIPNDEADSDSDEEWPQDGLLLRIPQGSGLAAIRRAREAPRQSNGPLELWPPVDDVARVAEQHSAWPASARRGSNQLETGSLADRGTSSRERREHNATVTAANGLRTYTRTNERISIPGPDPLPRIGASSRPTPAQSTGGRRGSGAGGSRRAAE